MMNKKVSHYVALKKIGYIFYLLEKDNCTANDIKAIESYEMQKKVMLESLDSFDTEIFLNTLSFPYDLALYKYLEHKKLSDENLDDACKYFSLDSKLLLSKLREFIKFSYLELVNNNSDNNFSQFATMISDNWESDDKLVANNHGFPQK